jgi:DNA-binding Lrp family transcriptional regulator
MTMIRAYVLIEVAVGRSADVVQALSAAEGVVSADLVTGPYDAIAMVESASIDGLGKLVVSNIHAIGGVSRTLTCPIVGL